MLEKRQRKLEVILSPVMYDTYVNERNCTVVVIDVFRATSAMCSAFENGVRAIIPVSSVEQADEYKRKGYLVGAERKAQVLPGFDFGNSPLTFQEERFKGETIVLTTTNGTRAIEKAKEVDRVVIGSFANISAIVAYLKEQENDIFLFCAGWKDRFNLEDTLFAGAVANRLKDEDFWFSDATQSAMCMHDSAKENLFSFLKNSSHRERLGRLNLDDDIHFCLQSDTTKKVPLLEGKQLIVKE